MYTKKYVQQVLRVNGLSPTSPDAEIKKQLAYTCCNLDEVFLSALRDPNVSEDAVICGTASVGSRSTILTAEQRLRPMAIKNLLGIDVAVNYSDLDAARLQRKNISPRQLFSIFVWSIVCATAMIMGVMWYLKVGFFHSFA